MQYLFYSIISISLLYNKEVYKTTIISYIATNYIVFMERKRTEKNSPKGAGYS